MSELLFHYNAVHPTTWVYLSSLLMIGLFFKFNRFWSVRNLDLILLILLSPGLLLVHFGERLMAEGDPKEVSEPALENPKPVLTPPISDVTSTEPAAAKLSATSGEAAKEVIAVQNPGMKAAEVSASADPSTVEAA